MKNRSWIILFIIAAAACLIIGLVVRGRSSGHIANIYQDGRCIRSVDLTKVNEPFEFTVKDDNGHENIVRVEPGRICVISANCPDQICVNTGWLSEGITPIVCMPAKLSINLEETPAEESDVDAVAG